MIPHDKAANLRHQDNRDDLASHVASLIDQLGANDIHTRDTAVAELAHLGNAVLPALATALRQSSERVRFEVVRCLRTVATPETAPELVVALEDESPDIRWIAAEALVGLGRVGMPALLRALEQAPWNAVLLRAGAHHVFTRLSDPTLRPILAPVLANLNGPEPSVTVPQAAYTARFRIEHEA